MTASWQCSTSLTPEQRLDVLNMCNRTEFLLGREALDEARRRIVVHGWTAQHWLLHRANALVGYALITGSESPSVEMCGGGFSQELLDALLLVHPRVDWWTRGDQVAGAGEVVRTLKYLRIDLPAPLFDVPSGARLRNFEPLCDEDAWLEQNNAAFADHPEQGAWSGQDLAERTLEPWFDPSGFLLLEIDGRIAASCWTKVHELHPDRFGEIYVVSVHPDFRGRGLGRVMVTQGLASLRKKGVVQGILFVDESNVSANRLYESLGFELQREDHLTRFTR